MAIRADRDLQRALIVTRKVVTGAVAVGMPVKDGSNDHEVQPCADGVGMIGVVIALGTGYKVSGGAPGGINDEVQIAYLGAPLIIPVKVGTGGATRGLYAKVVADGFTNATETVTTPVAMNVAGFFTQSGSAGDIVGLIPSRSWLTE